MDLISSSFIVSANNRDSEDSSRAESPIVFAPVQRHARTFSDDIPPSSSPLPDYATFPPPIPKPAGDVVDYALFDSRPSDSSRLSGTAVAQVNQTFIVLKTIILNQFHCSLDVTKGLTSHPHT